MPPPPLSQKILLAKSKPNAIYWRKIYTSVKYKIYIVKLFHQAIIQYP